MTVHVSLADNYVPVSSAKLHKIIVSPPGGQLTTTPLRLGPEICTEAVSLFKEIIYVI